MLSQTAPLSERFVVCASRSPAEAGSQFVGRAEIQRAAPRTLPSNTNSRWWHLGRFGETECFSEVHALHHPRSVATSVSSAYAWPRTGVAKAKSEEVLPVRHEPLKPIAMEPAFSSRRARPRKFRRAVTLPSARPNPSFKRSANGRPPAPGRWYAVHFHRPGAGVLPLPPA